ncbi:MAG: hypothetical protein WCG45_03625, partial [bacterium]
MSSLYKISDYKRNYKITSENYTIFFGDISFEERLHKKIVSSIQLDQIYDLIHHKNYTTFSSSFSYQGSLD